MRLTRKALFLLVAVCAISTAAKAVYMCCSSETVALCGDECCKTECDNEGKCSGCAKGEEWAYPGSHDFSDSLSPVKGKECCASENITYVQLSGTITVPFCCWEGETYQTTKVNGKNIGHCCSKTTYLKSLFIDNKYKSACCPNDGDHISVLNSNDNTPYCCPVGKSKTSDLSLNECCLDDDIYEENGTKKCCSSGKESEGCCKKKGGNWKNDICCSTTESNKTIDGTDNTSCGCAPTDYSESCCEENGGTPSHRMNVPQLDFLCCRSDGKTMQGDTISGCCMENHKKCSGSESHPAIVVCHDNMFSTVEYCKKNYVCEENESEVKCVCPKKASDCTAPRTKFDEENCLCVCPDDKPLYNPSKNQCESQSCETVADCPHDQCFECTDKKCVFKVYYKFCEGNRAQTCMSYDAASGISTIVGEDCTGDEVCVNGQCSSCPEGTTASDLDQSICCKNDKPGYFLYNGQEELATNGQMCGCPSPGASPDSTSQWCCHDGKATTPGNGSDNRINGEYKFVNNLTVQECGCPDGGDKKLRDNTYTCCKDGYEISVSDDSLTYAYNSVTASSIRLCQCPAGGTKGKLNDYCCKNGYGMKLTSGKEAVYPVDYSLYQRSSGMDIDTVKECGCPLLKDLVGDTCCDFDTGKAYNPSTDKYDTEDITCCKNIAEHNTTKECCKGNAPNKTTVLNGTDSYCCPNDKKDFVTAKGKCCSNSATYDSDKDCFCANPDNASDEHCRPACPITASQSISDSNGVFHCCPASSLAVKTDGTCCGPSDTECLCGDEGLLPALTKVSKENSYLCCNGTTAITNNEWDDVYCACVGNNNVAVVTNPANQKYCYSCNGNSVNKGDWYSLNGDDFHVAAATANDIPTTFFSCCEAAHGSLCTSPDCVRSDGSLHLRYCILNSAQCVKMTGRYARENTNGECYVPGSQEDCTHVDNDGNCCTDSAWTTYAESTKDCFCANPANASDNRCCPSGYKKCPGENFCVSESSCCPGDEYTGDTSGWGTDRCYFCTTYENSHWWDWKNSYDDEECCKSKGKKWCAETENYSGQCVEQTECCQSEKPTCMYFSRYGRNPVESSTPYECSGGSWIMESTYKNCSASGTCTKASLCCPDPNPAYLHGDSSLSNCRKCTDSSNNVWSFDSDTYKMCGNTCVYKYECCSDSDCSSDSSCGKCNQETHQCEYTYPNYAPYQSQTETEAESCCAQLGGHFCPTNDGYRDCKYGNAGCCNNELEDFGDTCYDCDRSTHRWVPKTDVHYCSEEGYCKECCEFKKNSKDAAYCHTGAMCIGVGQWLVQHADFKKPGSGVCKDAVNDEIRDDGGEVISGQLMKVTY